MPNSTYTYTANHSGDTDRTRKWLHIFGPYGGILLALSAILLIWFGTLYFSSNEKSHTERAAVTISENLARTFEEHIIRSIRAVDQTLLYVRDSYARNPDNFDISLWANNSQFLGDISFQVVIIGRDGRMIASNIPGASPGLDLSDREHFQIHKSRSTDELFISKPVFGRVSRKWSLQFTRPIIMRDGSFGGVAVVSVDPEYLGRFYESIDVGERGAIALIGADGIVRARGSKGPSKVGDSVAHGPLLTEYAKADRGFYKATSGLDGIERFFVYRKVTGYPLIVVVGLAVSEVLRPYEKSRKADLLYASLLTIWLLGIAILMWRYENSLRVSRDAAEAGTRARSEFLAMMSHEIRTPMNGVIGMAEVLLESGLTDKQSGYAQILRSSAQHLLTVLNDVLDFSKLEADRVEVEHVSFDLYNLVDSSVDLLKSLAQTKALNLCTEIDSQVPRIVVGDPARLRQVLFNLISNGLKFTETGGVIVSVAVVGEAKAHRLVFSVSDSGVGIPQDGMKLLFREFSQIDSTVARRFGGTGLGLAICKRLVELMGGTITARSAVGKGTTFSFELPCDVPEGQDATNLPEVVSPQSFAGLPTKLRILLAEDNNTNQLVITKLLESFGLQADVVGNGVEALSACSAVAYDVVLMDVMMPSMDGLTATRKIRALPKPFQGCQIIALTANAQTHDREVCLDAGMDDFLAKPVTRAALKTKLLSLRATADTTTIEPDAGAEPSEILLNRNTFEELRNALGEDDISLIVTTFFSDTKSRLKVMWDAARSDDRSVIKREAHAMKSAAGAIGLNKLSKAAASLDKTILGAPRANVPSQLRSLELTFDESKVELDKYLHRCLAQTQESF